MRFFRVNHSEQNNSINGEDSGNLAQNSTVDSGTVKQNPGAQVCLDEAIRRYEQLSNAYDRIYDRTSFGLGISGLVLLTGIESFDSNFVSSIALDKPNGIFGVLVLLLRLFGVMKAAIATYKMGMILRAKKFPSVSINKIQAENMYVNDPLFCSSYLFSMYCNVCKIAETKLDEKQKELDKALSDVVIGFLIIVSTLLMKNLGGY